MKKIGCYIHIPFCKQKCLYCDFISYSHKENLQKSYIEAIKKEIIEWKKNHQNIEFETIYIGGGTPSYVDSKYIVELMKIINPKSIYDKKEKEQISCTIEVNPGTVTKEKLQDYMKSGIERLSIGLQSTKDEMLKNLGRIHKYKDFLDTYKIAREVGFKNINVDLMIGLPSQNIEDIKSTLNEIMNLEPSKPEHISVYSLIIEEETPIQKLLESGKIKLPDEETERNMYWYVKNFLELNGYKHYEISNFAQTGFESKHNLDCWEQKEYIGFGAAAHSYIEGVRFCNISSLEEYIKNIENNNFEKNIIMQETQNKEEKMKEYMLLGLRKIDGVSITKFKNKFNENPIILYKHELDKLYRDGLIKIELDNIKLSDKGLDLANIVWEEFV